MDYQIEVEPPAEHIQKQHDKFELNVDQLLKDIVQPCGLWQWMVTLLLMLSSTSIATFPVYANSASPHRCRMEPHIEQFIEQNNLSFTHVASRIGPWDDATTNGTLLSPKDLGCFRYRSDWSAENGVAILRANSSKDWTGRELERCPLGFVFEESNYHYPGTVVAEFATVCERDWLVPVGTTLFLFGLALGMVISGWIGDQIGRKKSVIVFSVIELLAGIWTSLSPDVVNYILARTVMGIGNLGKANAANVLILEITTAKYRSLMTSSFALGTNFLFRSLIALWAFWIPNWRWLNLTTLSPHLLTVLYAYCLPESPRWLMSQDEPLEAVKVLKKGYLINHLGDPKPGMKTLNSLEELLTDDHTKTGTKWIRSLRSIRPSSTYQCLQSLIKSFSTPYLAKTNLCCIIIYAGISTSFFGLLYYARILYGSVYLNGFLNATTALPAAILTTLLYRYSRYRKRPLVGLIGLAFIILAVGSGYTTVYRPTDDTVLTVSSNIALLLHITIKGMCAVYMPELFPSEVRTQGYGIATGIGRFISISCLFLNELDKVTAHGVPLLIYSSMLLVTLVALAVLPETSGENISDLGKRRNREEAETDPTQPIQTVNSLCGGISSAE
ncbi:hypothetical protein P879_03432 [Paragonimus westermani]|uniref:Major facilitator superfamily (MFS) profile domain-containing protein n=1 Tax=Paragonimus westermani TaxID=34504 RepID=A0A8T0DNU6_9TREM|nr:hypothetical protein P879_03432 [Paragonimus westermani]